MKEPPQTQPTAPILIGNVAARQAGVRWCRLRDTLLPQHGLGPRGRTGNVLEHAANALVTVGQVHDNPQRVRAALQIRYHRPGRVAPGPDLATIDPKREGVGRIEGKLDPPGTRDFELAAR